MSEEFLSADMALKEDVSALFSRRIALISLYESSKDLKGRENNDA